MKTRRLLSLLCVLISTHIAGADLTYHPLNRNQLYQTFKNISLPIDANLVNAVFQDSNGMIYFGTQRGLYSYNGYDLQEYQDAMYPNGNSIFAIMQFDEQFLCIGTDHGIRWFNLTTKVIEDSYCNISFTSAVRSLAMYDGYLWVGTRDLGLMRISPYEGTTTSMNPDNVSETTIYSLEATENMLFIASYEHFSYYDKFDDIRHIVKLGCSERIMVNSLLWDKDRDCIWVGTEGYLYNFNIDSRQIYRLPLLAGNSCKSLSLDADNHLLIGTDAGLFVFDPIKDSCIQVVHDSRNNSSLCNNIIWDIYKDKNQNIWLATNRGVSLSQANTGRQYVHISEIVHSSEGNLFTRMFLDSFGDYWLGGENGLIHIAAKGKGYNAKWFRQDSKESHLKHNRIRHIYEDSSHDIWIASDGGIGKYDRVTEKFNFFNIQVDSTGKNANWAYSILEDKIGRVWIASYMGGLFVCNKETMAILYHFDENTGIGSNVYLMEEGDEDRIWASTSNGLVSIDINTFEVYQSGFHVDNMIYFDGDIWYSVLGKLYRYDTFTESNENIPFSKTCRQIFNFIREDDRIWFTSSEGLACIDPSMAVITNVSPTDNYYLCGLYNSVNGEIVLGGEDCILRINSNKNEIQHNSATPVFVTYIVSNGELMQPDKDYILSGNRIEFHEDTDFTIQLSTLSYDSEESYYYKFDNETQWQSLGKGQNHLALVNLSGGTYSLQLSNRNPESDLDAIISEYSIHIPYPWYMGWKAFVLYIILLGSAITAGIRIIHIRNKKKFELREKERSLELSNMKMDFFVNISHELKTPLSLIIAPVSKMLTETTNARQRETLTNIHNNALRLNTLIHKVLDFKQMETESENTLIRSRVELVNLIRSCVDTFSAVTGEKNISVNLQLPEDAIWANIDVLKIESAVINVLSNAIKYANHTNGKISIELKYEDDNAVITISDNGQGIDKDELSLIFIRYFQGKNSRQKEGSGIGLYLVKKYIELHSGTISIENDNGTKVRICIPLTGENSYILKDINQNSESVEATASAKILIIDDNREIVAFLTSTLSKYYECRKAYNGKDGLDLLNEYTPDLIIVDQMMPEMDGFHFAKSVRKNHNTATTPIIMLTAKDDMGTELESIKIGIDIFMPKPFDIKKLQLRIAQLLKKREAIESSVRIDTVAQPDFKECKGKQSPDEIFMEKATKIIEDNMAREDFNVSLLAEMLSVDTKQLYRKLKQLTGVTPVNYIRKLRLRKAAVLLEEDKFTISEVMYLVGYSNSSYFSKNFAEEFGVTPREFVTRSRKEEKGQI